jgi:sortase (surface protein transpeptidase)
VVAIVLLLTGAGSLGAGLSSRPDSLPGPSASPSAVGGPAAAPRVSQVVARSIPVRLRIPAIDLAVPLSELGLNRDGTVQVPTNFQEPGWYRLGPSPGQVGSAVILGHVDSYLGPAVFFRLRSLRPGDRVEVRLADGVITHFVVNTVAMYPKTHFPTRLVYGSRGHSGLQLVTCGGTFDTQTRSYLSNVVVYTSLVSVTGEARTSPASGRPAHGGAPGGTRGR